MIRTFFMICGWLVLLCEISGYTRHLGHSWPCRGFIASRLEFIRIDELALICRIVIRGLTFCRYESVAQSVEQRTFNP